MEGPTSRSFNSNGDDLSIGLLVSFIITKIMADFEHEQAGAELDQAQVKLEVIVIVGAKFVVEVEVED